MRILHLAQFFAPVIGGEERHVEALSAAQASRGHDVEVATLAHPERPDVLASGGVTVRGMRGSAQRLGALFSDDERRHAPPFPDPELTLSLARTIARFRPDVVHAHNWLLHSFLPIKSRSRAAMVVTLHDYGLVCARKTMMRDGRLCQGPSLARCLPCASKHYGAAVGLTTCLGNMASSRFERAAVDRFIAVSDAVARMCGLVGGTTPFDVLPTFIPDDVADLAPPDERVAWLPAGEFILYVGDLNRNKGVGVLLDAYARLPDAPPLVLIGRRCADMPGSIPPGVRIFESWPHSSVMHAWSRCLFGIAPSVWPEACGTIVMEANAVGKPMIASDIGGLSSLVAHGETGVLVPPGEAGVLAASMNGLVRDARRREAMGRAALAKAQSFMAKAVLPRIEGAYSAAIAARTTPSGILAEART